MGVGCCVCRCREEPHRHVAPVLVKARDDFTGQVRLRGLAPSTTYDYEARFDDGQATEGSFRTPPAKNDGAAVKLAFGGDIGGQNVCRDATGGYPSSTRSAPGSRMCSSGWAT